jgi:hypothetical protein
VADAVTFVLRPAIVGGWRVQTALPLNLCDVALVIAAITCTSPRWQLGVELTYFWGMAGTLQGVITPDLAVPFPQVEFFEFVVGHVGIVIAALYLVVGLGRQPRRGSVARAHRRELHVSRPHSATDVAALRPRPVAVVHRGRCSGGRRPVRHPRSAVPARTRTAGGVDRLDSHRLFGTDNYARTNVSYLT